MLRLFGYEILEWITPISALITVVLSALSFRNSKIGRIPYIDTAGNLVVTEKGIRLVKLRCVHGATFFETYGTYDPKTDSYPVRDSKNNEIFVDKNIVCGEQYSLPKKICFNGVSVTYRAKLVHSKGFSLFSYDIICSPNPESYK